MGKSCGDACQRGELVGLDLCTVPHLRHDGADIVDACSVCHTVQNGRGAWQDGVQSVCVGCHVEYGLKVLSGTVVGVCTWCISDSLLCRCVGCRHGGQVIRIHGSVGQLGLNLGHRVLKLHHPGPGQLQLQPVLVGHHASAIGLVHGLGQLGPQIALDHHLLVDGRHRGLAPLVRQVQRGLGGCPGGFNEGQRVATLGIGLAPGRHLLH